MQSEMNRGDTTQSRLIYSDGRVQTCGSDESANRLAYAVWLALPRGVRAAFRGVGDTSPVYHWDCVDKG